MQGDAGTKDKKARQWRAEGSNGGRVSQSAEPASSVQEMNERSHTIHEAEASKNNGFVTQGAVSVEINSHVMHGQELKLDQDLRSSHARETEDRRYELEVQRQSPDTVMRNVPAR